MADPNRAGDEAIEAVEAARETYVTEALLEAVRAVVALYRGPSRQLPPHVDALDRLVAAHESYARVFAAARAEGGDRPPPD